MRAPEEHVQLIKICRSTKSTEFSIKIQTQITILKLIKLEQKKKKEKKRKRRRAKLVGGEKRDPSDPFVCERELLECSGVDEVLEKKRKKKSEKRRNARKEKKKE